MTHLNLLRILFFAVAAVLTAPYVGARQSREISPDKLQTELSRLDRLLDNRENMINVRMRRIDNLRAQAVKTPNPENLHALADAFDDINNDSVMVYLQLAIDASSDSTERNRLRMQLASVMPLGGLFAEAQTKFNSVDTVSLSDAQKLDYYLYGRNLYYNIAQFFQDRPNFNEPWERRMAEYQARYLNALRNGPDDNRYRLAFGEYLFRTGKTADAQTVLRDVFQTESADTHVRSRSAYLMSQIARQQNDPDAYIYYLSQAVSADIHRGSVDLPSLHDLGMALYNVGDADRAYHYMDIAAQDASKTAIMARKVQASAAGPFVQSEHVAKLERGHRQLLLVVIALCLAVAVVGMMLVFTYREARKLKQMRHNLSNAAATREMYIAQFLSLCSMYMDRLQEFTNYVKRKISAGRFDEVTRMVQSDKFMHEQSEAFFQVFDDAFLHLYPDFVNQVNKLLLPDQQIQIKEGEQLNTDLRILAFMRMGIDDSGRIAHILNYSVNTIYVYRNKLRNRAINRDTFEQDILSITGN